MNPVLSLMLGYFCVLLLGFLFLNFLSGGYLLKFLRVKSSRGSKILVMVRSKLNFYSVVGRLEGDFLVYHDRESKANKQKTPKRISVDRVAFYRAYGVWCINVDEANNSVLASGGEVSGFDAIKMNNLFERALYKPSPEANDKILVIIILVLAVLSLILLAAVFVKLNKLHAGISALANIGRVVSSNVV